MRLRSIAVEAWEAAALLDGTMAQKRVPLFVQPRRGGTASHAPGGEAADARNGAHGGKAADSRNCARSAPGAPGGFAADSKNGARSAPVRNPLAHLKAGALLWVQEPFTLWRGVRSFHEALVYHADQGATLGPKPPALRNIHCRMLIDDGSGLRRGESRLTLIVESVARVPLWPIPPADAAREGIARMKDFHAGAGERDYLAIWDRTWGRAAPSRSNPVVALLRFRVVRENIGSLLVEHAEVGR